MNNHDLKFTLRFNAENKQFIGQVRAAAGSVDSLGTHATTTGRKLTELAKESGHLGANFTSLKNQVYGLVGGFSALMAANDAKDKLGQYQDIRTQITALVGGQQQWIETEQYLNRVAEDHNKTLLSMAGNYSRLAVLQEAGLTTQKETRSIFEGMSNAQSQLGASSAQLEQAMYGLSQAISSPVVHAEELNQVVEPLPGLLNKLDKAAGLQAGGFRKMVNNGKVTSKFFKDTLVQALNEYQGAAARTASNITAQQAELTRSYQQMVVAYEQPISEVFGTSVKASSSVLRVFADNAETVSSVVGVTLAAAAGRGVAALATLTAEKIKSVAASRQQLQATVAETQAELAATQAEIRHLETMQLSNNQKFRAIGAEASLAAAQARRKVLTDTLTASQTRLNLVMRAGSGVMSALGGPVGVAMMAASALSYFAMSARSAKTDTGDLEERVDLLLGRMDKLKDKELSTAIDEQKSKVAELRREYQKIAYAPTPERSLWQKITETNSEMRARQVQESREAANAVYDVAGKLSKAEANLTALQKKLQVLRETKPETPASHDEAAAQKKADAAKKLLANLQKQVALYGQTSQVAKVRYETEHGSLKGINEQLKKQLLLQAQLLDKKNPKSTGEIDAFYQTTDAMRDNLMKRLAIRADYQSKARIEEEEAYQTQLDALKASYDKAVIQAQDNHATLLQLEREYQAAKETAREAHEFNLSELEKQQQKQREEENKGYWQRYLDSAKQNLTDFDDLAASTIDSFSSGMGSAFESMIFDADSLGDAMFNLADGMARSLVNALGKMAAQWLAYQAVQMLVGTQTQTAAATSLATTAQAQAMMAGLNAFTSTAAIPITGPMMAPEAMSTALAVTEPIAAAVQTLAFSGIAGQAHDGIDRVPTSNEGTWLLKADEMVLNPTQADNFRWMAEMMQQMRSAVSSASSGSATASASSGGVVVNIHTQPGETATTQQSQTASGDTQLDIYIQKAVTASMNAMYQDADNGGPVSTRIRANTL